MHFCCSNYPLNKVEKKALKGRVKSYPNKQTTNKGELENLRVDESQSESLNVEQACTLSLRFEFA